MNKILNWLITKPERFFMVALIFFTTIVFSIDYILNFNGIDDWKGVLTEAHGMLLDIIVFGILLSIYEKVRLSEEKRREEERNIQDKIERYIEEIEDYRYWNEEEAKIRIIGNVKRLQLLKVTELNLSECNISNSKLENLTLKSSKLIKSNLSNSTIKNVNFSDTVMIGTKMQGSNIGNVDNRENDMTDEHFHEYSEGYSVSFKNADLKGVNFSKTQQRATHFESANLVNSTFEESILMQVHFEDAILTGIYEGEEYKADFSNCYLLGCTAYEYQRTDFIKCGADIQSMIFVEKI